MAGEIVLGYDDTEESRAALPVAVQLAKTFGTTLIVGFGYEPPRSGGEVGALRVELEKLGEEFGAAALDQIRAIDTDLPVQIELVQDRPSTTIVRLADASDARFIVVGHRARSALAEALLGSVLDDVLAATARPVVVVQSADD